MFPWPRPLGSGAALLSGTQGAFMPATGELIRMMNYVDDISATLRRVSTSIPTMTPEERTRLAEYIRKSDPNYDDVLKQLDAGGK
jgi:hypothetical protein